MVHLALSVALVVVSLFLAGSVLFAVARAKASTGWPGVDGKIVLSRISRTSGGRGTYAEIRYTYRVANKEYVGERLSFGGLGDTFFSAATSAAAVSRHPEGQTLRVRVCPSNPEFSVLEPGLGWEHLASLASALLFLIGLLIFLVANL